MKTRNKERNVKQGSRCVKILIINICECRMNNHLHL